MSEPAGVSRSLATLRSLLSKLLGPKDRPKVPDARTEAKNQREKLRIQADVIRRAYDGEVSVATAGDELARDDADAHYLFRPHHLLIRADRLEEVSSYIAARPEIFAGELEHVGRPTEGLVVARVPGRRDNGDPVLATLDELDRAFSRQDEKAARGGKAAEAPVASPDHVIYVTNRPTMCPATEPERPPGRAPAPFPRAQKDPSLGRGIRVSVVDTGLWDKAVTSTATPWMHGVLADPEDLEVIDPQHIHPYGGHGTFVAGVVRCLAPGSRVEVEGVLTHGGAVYESEIVAQLDQALQESDHPQLISISAGSRTRSGYTMLSFEMLASTYGLDDGEQTLIVAAAGNDGSKEPFWPAAFPWVAAVGSVDPDGKVSDYSNHGPWVDVYARGRDLVNAFPTGTYTCHEPPNAGQVRTFHDLAQWSGTSFATPVVTGLIAARMSETGESALQAYAAVKAAGSAPIDAKAGQSRTVGPLT